MGMNSLGEPEVAAAKRQAVTLQDVADEADVAVSTASCALSNPYRDPVVRRSGGLLLNVAAGSLFNRRQLGVA
jgi:hypothetical protein